MWIELHDTLLRSRKIRRLARIAGIPEIAARGHLVTLWLTVLGEAPDGDLDGWETIDISAASDWDGDPDRWVAHLVEAGLLDLTEHGWAIHDWMRYAAHLKIAERRKRDRERKRKQRAARETSQNTSTCHTDVTGTSHGRPGNSALTRPDLNRPDLDLDHCRVRHDASQREQLRADVAEVVAHYRRYHPRALPRPRSDSREVRLIRARLAEGYTVSDLCAAIDGIHTIPHNLGHNDQGRKYLALSLIMRDASHVDRYREALEQRGQPPPGSWAATVEATRRWADGDNQPGGAGGTDAQAAGLLPEPAGDD